MYLRKIDENSLEKEPLNSPSFIQFCKSKRELH